MDINNLESILSSAIALAAWVAGLFFLRFWKRTGDKFFIVFTASFWILSIERIVLIIMDGNEEWNWQIFLIRLLAFLLLLIGILVKNMR